MNRIRWKRDHGARCYRCEYGTITVCGSAWRVSLSSDLVRDSSQRIHIADTLTAAKNIAEGRIRAWLDRDALLADVDRLLTHYEQIMARLDPIDYHRRDHFPDPAKMENEAAA